MNKKVLVVGGTGAMGVYLVPELLSMGYQVDVLALDTDISDDPNLHYIQGNAKDYDTVEKIVKREYAAVVDFMIYYTREEYERFLPVYLEHTEHYIFLSTYRIYADEEHPIRETSPRILDVTKDEKLLQSGDYCIYKAQTEDFLKKSEYENWTIVRPAITYSKRRFQLITMEYDLVIRSMLEHESLVVPENAMVKQATMSWAGDVARMLARLVLNKRAYKETYSVCTSEHHTWEEIAQMYQRIGGLKYCVADTETFLNIIAPGNIHARQQLLLDRYYDRVMDNSKILNITGMKQSELMPLEEGLAMEFRAFPKNYVWQPDERMDRMKAYCHRNFTE